MFEVFGRLDADRLNHAAVELGGGGAVGELRGVLEGLAVGGNLERPGLQGVAALGPAGGRGDGLHGDRLVEDEGEVVGGGRILSEAK